MAGPGFTDTHWRITVSVVGNLAASSPAARAVAQTANALLPNEMPSVDAFLHMWNTGYLTEDEFIQSMKMHGIPVGSKAGTGAGAPWAEAWRRYVISQYPRPDPMFTFQANLRGLIHDDHMEQVSRHTRVNVDLMNAHTDAYRNWMTVADNIALYNRQYFTQDDYFVSMKHTGGYRADVISAYAELATIIPGPQDLIRFVVRDTFNEGLVKDLELNAEIGDTGPARQWCQRQGLGKSKLYVNGQATDEIDWYEKFWQAHWSLPSPTQLYEFFHRLRPERLGRYKDRIPTLTEFTLDKMQQYMKANDYTPPVRDWLTAISFRTPRLVDMRNQYYQDIITRDDLVELQKDSGYTAEDAENFARLADVEKERYKYRRRTPLIDKYDTAYYNETIQAYRVGAISEQTLHQTIFSILLDTPATNAVVNAEATRRNNAVIKQCTDTVRRSYFTGELVAEDAKATLRRCGIDPSYVETLVTSWEIRFDVPRRVVSAQKLLLWYSERFIVETELLQRLHRLGFSARDISGYLLEANRKRAKADKKKPPLPPDDGTGGPGGGSGSEELEKYLTPERVKGWMNGKYITEEEAKELLRSIQVPEERIDLHLGLAPRLP